MRCALLGPIPGSLPSSSIRSWTGPSNISLRSGLRQAQRAAHPAGQRTELLLGQGRDLFGGVTKRADKQVLQRLDVVGVDDLWINLDRDDLAAPLDDDLAQTATGLAVDLGADESLLGSHQLLLHLLCLGEQPRHVGLASGLHDSPLASWYRLGFACVVRAVQSSKRSRRRANVAPCASLIACVSGLPRCWEAPAPSLPSPPHRLPRLRSRHPAASPA